MYPTAPYWMHLAAVAPHYPPPHVDAPPEPRRSALPAPGHYVIDPDASSVGFAVRELGLVVVRGRFATVSGTFRIGRGPTEIGVDAEIPVATLRTGIRKRDGDLLGRGFFDAGAHPALRFTADRIGTDLGAWTLPGRLEVRRIGRPVDLRLDPVLRGADGAVTLRGTAEVDRREFGISAPRVIIGHRVRIDVEITARRLPAQAPVGRS